MASDSPSDPPEQTPTPPAGSFFRHRERESTAPVVPGGLAPGREIGDFRLVRKLGEGGMGQVWQATQISLDRAVALKLMPSDQAMSDSQLAMFEREARAGGRLHHPSIVSVLAYGEADGIPFIAQELIGDGWSLADCLREAQAMGDLPDDWFRRIASFIATSADALQVAHDTGVVHRDLKPANILIAEDDRPVIADFGLARVSGMESISRTGDMAGTYAYMSPEQALAKRIGVDHRADIYALGATLYEALTLRRAVEGDTHQQITENIIYADPPAPHMLRSKLDRDLSVVAMKALEKQRQDRYQTMAEFAGDLRRWLGNEPVLAKPAGPVRRARKWMARHPTASAVMGIVVASALGFAWFSTELAARNQELVEADLAKGAALKDAQDQRARADSEAATATVNAERADANAATAKEAEELAQANARIAETNATRAEREKANVLRLSAFQELEDLRAEADALWPPTPELLDSYDEWLVRAAALVVGIEPSAAGEDRGHRQQLIDLRQRALARTEEQRQAERSRHPKYAEWETTRATIAKTESGLTAFRTGLGDTEPTAEQAASLQTLEARLVPARELLAQLEAEIDERQAYRFADSDDTWWHNQLSKLIAQIEAFADPETGLIEGVSEDYGWGVGKRRAFAASVEERTLTGEDATRRWSEAIASIADREQCPQYDGLELAAQLGLLPIGRDPASGLWEFWHVESGDEPQRGEDDTLALTEASGMVLVLIPGGAFSIGAQSTDIDGQNYDPDAQGDEGPVHEVTLSAYFLSKYEMTQGQWERFTGRNPSNYGLGTAYGDHTTTLVHPVEQVSWNDALLVLPRLGLQLPTEAQWERAARGGTTSVWWTGNERDSLLDPPAANLADQAAQRGGATWTDIQDWPELDDGFVVHAPVNALRPNPFGLHHVHGNVWEWCLDSSNGYSGGSVQDPVIDVPGARYRVYRGGSFSFTASIARCAFRDDSTPGLRNNDLGLRPAKGISP